MKLIPWYVIDIKSALVLVNGLVLNRPHAMAWDSDEDITKLCTSTAWCYVERSVVCLWGHKVVDEFDFANVIKLKQLTNSSDIVSGIIE